MRDEILVPHLYLDSNVILDVLRDRRPASLQLMERTKRDEWFVSTSPFAIMEVFDAEQDDRFFQIKVSEGNTVGEVLRIRHQRDLSRQLLEGAQNQRLKNFAKNPVIFALRLSPSRHF